jgi:hypothetical protein
VRDDKTVGIVVIVALTLFALLLYGFVGALSAGVYAMTGGATGEGNPTETNTEITLIALPFIVMAMYAFLLSLLILLVNSKIVWFAAIAFWVANAIFWAQLVLRWSNFRRSRFTTTSSNDANGSLALQPQLHRILHDFSHQETLQPSTEHQTRTITSPSALTATNNTKETTRKKRRPTVNENHGSREFCHRIMNYAGVTAISKEAQILLGLIRKLINHPSSASPRKTAKPFANEERSSVPNFVPKPPR